MSQTRPIRSSERSELFFVGLERRSSPFSTERKAPHHRNVAHLGFLDLACFLKNKYVCHCWNKPFWLVSPLVLFDFSLILFTFLRAVSVLPVSLGFLGCFWRRKFRVSYQFIKFVQGFGFQFLPVSSSGLGWNLWKHLVAFSSVY